MVSIEKYSVQRIDEASELSVRPDQAEFTVGNINDVVANLKDTEHPHLIVDQNKAVGFFLLDLDYTEKYHFSADKAIGVRALLIDQRHQGRGIASQAISQLPNYIRQAYPEYETLQLTVNCRNKPAYQCYLKCGFVDMGNLYTGGPVGPQHIMQFKLAA